MKSLLTLITTPAMEEPLIDWLLSQDQIKGFTSHLASGHGQGHAMSVAEQVTGRRKQLVFWLELQQQDVDVILQQLAHDFNGGNVHYWVMPLSGYGVI